MSLVRYLGSCWPAIAISIIFGGLLCFVLGAAGIRMQLVMLAAALMLLALLLMLLVDYGRKREFLQSLERLAGPDGCALWPSEMVDCPDFIEGRVAYDALVAMSRAANEQIAEYRRQALEYREYVETWVHEAKSPLAASHLMLENLEDELSAANAQAPSPAVLCDRIRALDDELDRMEGYVEQALFYARSEALDRDYLVREYGLGDLVSAALRANARSLISARVSPCRKNLDYKVFTDEKWMLFVLGQLIQNSVKYAAADGAVIEFRARLLDEGLAEERVELCVRDNGRGVSASDLPRVFDKGFTGDAGRTGKRATGIGLYLVKRLCDKMGVGVSADSRQGEYFEVALTFSTNRFRFFE